MSEQDLRPPMRAPPPVRPPPPKTADYSVVNPSDKSFIGVEGSQLVALAKAEGKTKGPLFHLQLLNTEAEKKDPYRYTITYGGDAVVQEGDYLYVRKGSEPTVFIFDAEVTGWNIHHNTGYGPAQWKQDEIASGTPIKVVLETGGGQKPYWNLEKAE